MADHPKPKDVIPHRDPFLFIDEVVEAESGKSARAIWTLKGSEWFFAGHFPDRPTLPGVLMVESLAQAGAYAILLDDQYKGKLPLFGGIDGVRFRRQVEPGHQLTLSVELTRMSSKGGKGHGIATVGGEVACEADLLFVLVDA